MNKRLVTRILVVLLVKAGVPSRCLSFLDFMTEGTAIRAKMFADGILMVHERVWKVARQTYPCSRVAPMYASVRIEYI